MTQRAPAYSAVSPNLLLNFRSLLFYTYNTRICFSGIVTSNRSVIQASLMRAANEDYEASFRISFVNGKLVLPLSDQTLNRVITPIACVVVFLLTALIVALEIRKLVSCDDVKMCFFDINYVTN